MTVQISPPLVREFRQLLLWPLQLVAQVSEGQSRPWEQLAGSGPWVERQDELDSAQALQERHYSEFVTFLPYVQRFLYGEGRRNAAAALGGANPGSPMRIFRRSDITQLRVRVCPGAEPLLLRVDHIDLYFFYDLDVVLLNVEVSAQDLPLPLVQELMYKFGRAYPGGWQADGPALHCLYSLEWLNAEGAVMACSDAQQRDLFLAFVAAHRAPRIAAHWAHLLQPMVPDLSDEKGALRYRQIEVYRMPTMAYLALDEPQKLSRADFVRLGLVTGAPEADAKPTEGAQLDMLQHDMLPHDVMQFDETRHYPGDTTLPYAEDFLAQFEARHCHDRFWAPQGNAPYTRYMASGHALVVVGDARSAFFSCAERGVLAQFRHQQFLLFLIAHVQKAALLMFSDRLVDALKRLDVRDAGSVKQFKRSIRHSFEGFLRFTHRYWFHEISEQALVRSLFQMTAKHLDLDALYLEVKERTADMNGYLDADSLRRQANTVVRLTVVTILGLIGTITTGFLGMNLIAAADAPTAQRVLAFIAVMAGSIGLTVFTIVRSKRLSDFLDALSDERLAPRHKWAALLGVFWRP